MGKDILDLGIITVVEDSALIYGGVVDGTKPKGYRDSSFTKQTFLKEVNEAIEDNSDSIAIIEADITVLQELSTKDRYAVRNFNFIINQPADSLLDSIIIINEENDATVSIGIGSYSNDDIVSSRQVNDGSRAITSPGKPYTAAPRDLYISISGGIVDIIVFSKTNINT